MNYYKRHLGDYARDAAHLTLAEHGAFTVLLDRYYSTEKPITTEDALRVCRARSGPDKDTVLSILKEFFREGPEGWTNKRADEEIEAYNVKADKNREIGKKGGRPKTQTVDSGNPDGFVLETQTVSESEPKPNPSHKPLATSHEKAPPTPKGATTTFKAWIESLPEGAEAIPADHHVFRYAERVGIPAPFVTLAWVAFERRYRGVSKRYSRWPDVFRKAVEGNWGKLWWLNQQDAYELTTVGKQLQREIAQREAA